MYARLNNKSGSVRATPSAKPDIVSRLSDPEKGVEKEAFRTD